MTYKYTLKRLNSGFFQMEKGKKSPRAVMRSMSKSGLSFFLFESYQAATFTQKHINEGETY